MNPQGVDPRVAGEINRGKRPRPRADSHLLKEKGMRKQTWTLAVALGMSGWLSGCGGGEVHGREPEAAVPGEAMVEDASARSSFVEREFWLALAEEPGWHLNAARDLFLGGKTQEASQELGKVATILNFESRHSHSSREEGLLLASVQELREVSRELRDEQKPLDGPPSTVELDRVAALAFRTIAAHQVTLARDALEAGDVRMAGRYILETSKAVESGFGRANVEMGNALTEHLQQAREVAAHMEIQGDGSIVEGRATLDNLNSAVKGLGEVVTSRRK